MDIYKNKSRWKYLLAIIGMLIILATMLYSQYLARNLAERENINVQAYAKAIRLVTSSTDPHDNTNMELFVLDSLGGNIPIIMEDESGSLIGYHYEGKDSETEDQDFLSERKAKILKKGYEPIKGYGSSHRIYYENSDLYSKISLFPLAQFLLLATFVGFGYYLFSTARKGEQNRVWAGMAKETAHQLGTPISAIIGWIEHLKMMSTNDETKEVVSELRNDVSRLELIADRFSKIGSKPELSEINLSDRLQTNLDYIKRRASRKIEFDYYKPSSTITASINTHLFDWVIENLLRNALDAMEGHGKISVVVNEIKGKAQILITDTGKGIAPGKFKTVFEPGFTTKKRGWGLGLSLAKRIIEQYHSGKIYVKESKPNEKTTFAIELPSH